MELAQFRTRLTLSIVSYSIRMCVPLAFFFGLQITIDCRGFQPHNHSYERIRFLKQFRVQTTESFVS